MEAVAILSISDNRYVLFNEYQSAFSPINESKD